jgi:hypothetical protein
MRELKTTHLDQDGIYQNENQWVLDTEGVNLLDVSLLLLTQCARTLFKPYFEVCWICLSHALHQDPAYQLDCSFCVRYQFPAIAYMLVLHIQHGCCR